MIAAGSVASSCGASRGWAARAIAGLKELAPYAAIELVLPGGSLVAILLWLHRRYRVRRVGDLSAS
jgi:hypothetical protein